nr:cytosine permease [Streptomyces antimycoticus]
MTHDASAPVYGSAVTKVEPFGVDHIPETERHGKPSSQFFVWFAAGLNFPIILLGFSAAWFGLSFPAAVTAIVIGAALGSLLMAVMSRMGVRLGVPQQIQARGPLGFFGNFIPVAYINVFAGIGWAAVTVILGGKAFAGLTHMPFWLCAGLLTLIEMVVAVFGYNMINFLQKALTYVLTPLFALITVVAVIRGGSIFHANPDAQGYIGSTGGLVTFGGWFLSFLVAWAPFASDYSRYLPDTPAVITRTAWYTGLGNFVTICWLGILGVVVGGSATSSDSITALHQLAGPFALPALLAVGLSALAQNFLNVYGGAISIQTLKVPVTRSQAVIGICVLAYALSLWGESGTEANQGLPQPHRVLHRPLRRGAVARLLPGRPLRREPHPRTLRPLPRAGLGLRSVGGRGRRIRTVLAVRLLHRTVLGGPSGRRRPQHVRRNRSRRGLVPADLPAQTAVGEGRWRDTPHLRRTGPFQDDGFAQSLTKRQLGGGGRTFGAPPAADGPVGQGRRLLHEPDRVEDGVATPDLGDGMMLADCGSLGRFCAGSGRKRAEKSAMTSLPRRAPPPGLRSPHTAWRHLAVSVIPHTSCPSFAREQRTCRTRFPHGLCNESQPHWIPNAKEARLRRTPPNSPAPQG